MIKQYKGNTQWSDQMSEEYIKSVEFLQLLFNKKTTTFIFDLNKNRAIKALASLQDMRQGILCSISILNIVNQWDFWMHDDTVNFFEVSMFNFFKNTNIHHIMKQGFIFKKAGGRPSKNYCWCVCLKPMSSSRKWFILTNQFLCYVEKPFSQTIPEYPIENQQEPSKSKVYQQKGSNKKDDQEKQFLLKEVLLIDSLWEVVVKGGLSKTKLKVHTNNRVLSLKFYDYNFKSWVFKIQSAVNHSPWSKQLERFVESSFAPMRRSNSVKLMIDGECYFRNVAEELKKAQFEIFITDWWLCAKYYLVRPVSIENKQDEENFRLDKILLEAAERGVIIYILHWKESKFAVNFNSLITKEYLQGLHPNIKMARHSGGAIQLWSHHAKLVIIDQMIAFIGGLDICYGRWDTRNHLMTDIGLKDQDQCIFPGNDYCNEKKTPLTNTEDYAFCTLNRETEARMPFHDTAVCIEGESATDLSHHFVHLWNNSKLDKHGKRAKVASITTNTKNRSIFRKAFKKMKFGSTAGVVTMGYQNKEESKRQKEVLKQLKQQRASSNEQYDVEHLDIHEDQKFEEGLEGIIQKNENFQQFKDRQNTAKSPNKLSALNNLRLKGKFQNMIEMLKKKPIIQPHNPKNAENQTPKSDRNFENVDQRFFFGSGFKIQPHNAVHFETPDPKYKLHEFEKIEKIEPPSGIQASVGKESDREDQKFKQTIEDAKYAHPDNALQDSGIILQKSHTIPQQSLEGINMNSEESLVAKEMLATEEQKQLDREEQFEHQIESNQKRKLKSLKSKLLRTRTEIPYNNAEENQILTHTPFKRLKPEMQQVSLENIDEDSIDKQVSAFPGYAHSLQEKREMIEKNSSACGNKFIDNKIDSKLYNNCMIQALRSVSPWSLGVLKVEHSIYEAYIQLIEQSQKFIYIENQFFITQCVLYERNKRNLVKNKIGLALRERILRANRHNEDFFVMIFVPLLPAFSGDILESSSSILRIQVNYQMKSMAKGKSSLIELLRRDGIQDPWKYIKFFSLRGHTMIQKTQTPISEMIYIHSKTMVVDDTHMIIGSANINDRSMLGSRDHELAVVISQPEADDQITVNFNGKPFKVSKLAHTFRTELMMEHFGLPYDDIKDPIYARNTLVAISDKNSKLFFEIFKCEPDEQISTFAQLIETREIRKKEQEDNFAFRMKYQLLKDQILGHVVNYPVYFLKDEKLGQNFFNSEILVPEITFV